VVFTAAASLSLHKSNQSASLQFQDLVSWIEGCSPSLRGLAIICAALHKILGGSAPANRLEQEAL
jgi:hypothetical protein